MEKKIYELKIDPELAGVAPPLAENELRLLQQDILQHGCKYPLIVWNGMIVDGHNRYRICRDNGVPFTYEEMEFPSKEQAKFWIVKNQLGRRNLKPFQRCEMVAPFEKEVEAEVEQNRRNNISNTMKTGIPGHQSMRSREIMADMAGVSPATYARVKVIIELADEDTKEKLRNEEVGIKPVFNQLTKKNRKDPDHEERNGGQEPAPPDEEKADPQPVSYIDHPMEDPVTMHEPERKPMPYQFVKEQVEFAVRNMIADMKIGLYGLRNEDFDRKRELKNILKDGYKQAAQIIDEMEKIS